MVKIKHLNTKEQKAVGEFIYKIIKKLKSKVVLVKLFGSKARGDYHKWSDIDILLVTKDKIRFGSPEDDIIAKLKNEIILNYDIYISIVNLSLGEYEKYKNPPTPFIYWVNKEGINLWQREKIKT